MGECYENTKKYTRLVQRLKLEERVIFENRFVNVNEAAQYFSAATAVVLPYKKRNTEWRFVDGISLYCSTNRDQPSRNFTTRKK